MACIRWRRRARHMRLERHVRRKSGGRDGQMTAVFVMCSGRANPPSQSLSLSPAPTRGEQAALNDSP